MRIARRNYALGGLLIVLLALHFALRDSSADAREIVPLFPGFTPEAAQRIELGVGADTLLLERDGERWGLAAAFGHPARPELVQRLLDRLVALDTTDLLSQRPESHAEYGVAGRERVVRVYAADGALLVDLLQGETRPVAGGVGRNASFVRRVGDDAVYRAARFEPLTVDMQAWLDNRLFAFEPALINTVRLRVAGPQRSVTVARRDVDRWARESGEAVSARKVRAFLDRASALFFGEVEAASPEGALPGVVSLEIELERAGLEPLTARFGAPDPVDGTVLAVRDGHAWVVRFDARSYALIEEAARALLPPL